MTDSLNKKYVSVIVPAFNRASVIRDTIESVQRQKYSWWELIIVDDGSTDDTVSFVQGLAATDDRIRFFERTRLPKGAPTCRNIGLENASGEYVMFLDSDDILLPETLSGRVAAFEKFPHLDFLAFPSAFFTNKVEDATVLWNRFDERNDVDRFLAGDVAWHTSGSFFKRSYLRKQHLAYSEAAKTSQDWEFHMKILLLKPSYKKMDGPPDSFIRRNNSYAKISDEHGSRDKIINRIELMLEMSHSSAIHEDDYQMAIFCMTILREFNMMLNKEFVLNASYFSQMKKHHLSSACRKALNYIKAGNAFLKIHPMLFKIYRKVFYRGELKELFRVKTFYRSAMTEAEKNAFRQLSNIAY